ncbi:hypothetical protein HK102_009568 [Quaeritorhiza haematococci]|nr:hypothetical protein HK102_009568 [Quaeritorhiza haematococci]
MEGLDQFDDPDDMDPAPPLARLTLSSLLSGEVTPMRFVRDLDLDLDLDLDRDLVLDDDDPGRRGGTGLDVVTVAMFVSIEPASAMVLIEGPSPSIISDAARRLRLRFMQTTPMRTDPAVATATTTKIIGIVSRMKRPLLFPSSLVGGDEVGKGGCPAAFVRSVGSAIDLFLDVGEEGSLRCCVDRLKRATMLVLLVLPHMDDPFKHGTSQVPSIPPAKEEASPQPHRIRPPLPEEVWRK